MSLEKLKQVRDVWVKVGNQQIVAILERMIQIKENM